MRIILLILVSGCSALNSSEQEDMRAIPNESQLPKSVPVAPAPRDRRLFTVKGGLVTSVETNFIKVQGFEIRVNNAKHTKLIAVGRVLAEESTGPDLTIRGSFPTLKGVKAFTDYRTYLTVTHADDTTSELHRREQPHRKYMLSDALRAGYSGIGVRGEGLYIDTYRVSDLQIGDEISMQLEENHNDFPVCEAFRITRRANGQVPPAPGELEDRKKRASKRPLWHDRMNALQDWEERGVPLPFLFHPGGPKASSDHPGAAWPQLAPPPRAK